MNEVVNSVRSANKRAVNDINDDESNEPPVKKEAEPVPTKEVLELQQKLTKTEEDKQRAIRIAGEAQARVEFLENLIDKKPATTDDLDKKLIEEQQKKIEELSSKLVEADGREKKLADEKQNTIHDLTKDRDDLVNKLWHSHGTKREHQKRIGELTNQLEAEKELFNARINNLSSSRIELSDELITEKRLLKEEKKRVRALTKELESERSQADADRMRIDELTIARDELERKLADSEQKKMDELRNHRAKLARELAEADEREQKLVEEQQKRLAEQCEAVRRAAAGRERHQPERIVKLTRSKLNLYDGEPQLQPPNPRQPIEAEQHQSDNVSLKKAVKTEIDASTGDSSLANTGGTKFSSNIFEIDSTVATTRGALVLKLKPIETKPTAVAAAAPAANDGASTSEKKETNTQGGRRSYGFLI